MALTPTVARVSAIDRFRLVSARAATLAAFYEAAFDARIGRSDQRVRDESGAARKTVLTIGAERIELVTFDSPGAPYPADAIASDSTFQHFAIVVPDMREAYARLRRVDGWRPISRDGPQRLPANTGGVTAFKFRDPEGHPIELIEFQPSAMPARWNNGPSSRIALGIDHTAISIADTATSIAFYHALGLSVAGRSSNRGNAQDRLDGMDQACVDVVALSPADTTPHIELLCYASRRPVAPTGPRDIAATQVILRADVALGALQDPDAHRLFICAGG